MLELELSPDPLDVCVRAVLPDGRPAGLTTRPRVTLHDVRSDGRVARSIATAPRDDGPGEVTFCATGRLTPGATYQVWIAGDECRAESLGDLTLTTGPMVIPESATGERPTGRAHVGALVVACVVLAIALQRRRRMPTIAPA